MVRYARRHVLPDEVEDVVAETFVVAWRRLDEVPPYGLPWRLGVARNVSANIRRARRRQEALSDRMALHHHDEEPLWPETGAHDAVTAALHRLSDADRELLTLIAWDGLDPAEAAEALGCSRNALKVRLHRARRRFAALLGQGTAYRRSTPEPALPEVPRDPRPRHPAPRCRPARERARRRRRPPARRPGTGGPGAPRRRPCCRCPAPALPAPDGLRRRRGSGADGRTAGGEQPSSTTTPRSRR